jgi:hypothetical protein
MSRTLLCSACLQVIPVTADVPALEAAYWHVLDDLAAHPLRLLTVMDVDATFEGIVRRSYGKRALR